MHRRRSHNNAYTNIMAAWVLLRALEVLDLLPDMRRAEIMTRLGLSADEIARWMTSAAGCMCRFMATGSSASSRAEQLAELDWEDYRTRYGNIQRLDLILEAEHDSANRYKLSKQADVLMLFYLFSAESLARCSRVWAIRSHTTPFRATDLLRRRSSHGSTLSRVVHAWVLARSDRPRAMATSRRRCRVM